MKEFKSKPKIIPIILSGGSGTRLWPLSRECYPKQYINLDEYNKLTLLQNTFSRLQGLENLNEPIIICNEEQRFIVAEQMREINTKPHAILLEPLGRNTAPAITLSSLIASKESQDPLLLILSADHSIKENEKFRETLAEGYSFAEEGRIVTFGVKPSKPETGYGYIESYDELTDYKISSNIKRFIEKPDKKNAEKFFKNKKFLWNSGIFLSKASTILNELKRYQPKIFDLCKKSLDQSKDDLDFVRIKSDIFKKCPSLPIDIAVMEKTNLGTVISLDVGWSDVGSWNNVWENSHKDKAGNSTKGNVIIKKAENCYVRSENRLVVGVGIKNLAIIETYDAILILEKESNQVVKEIVKELDKCGFEEGKVNKKMYRPWGNYTGIVNGASWQVKRLEINEKASLSLQLHHHRSEHWIVVDGTAKIEIDGVTSILKKNESIYVPLGSKHRLSNPGKIPLIIIEVQCGTYLGEDDIIRFEDLYRRKTLSSQEE